MNHSEQMAKLRAIITGETGDREQLDEMFQYPRDKSPAGQRAANKPQDALAKRGAVKNPIAKDPAGYKGMVKGTSRLFGTTAKDVYKMHGPKGVLPEEEDVETNNSELEDLMRKYGVMEDASCNMTSEGEECPVHGLDECGMYEDVDADENVSESVHITLDGPEADMMINRLLSLAGQTEHSDQHHQADPCPGCGMPDCQCGHDEPGMVAAPMENANHDYGHETHSAEGEPQDPETYMYDAPQGDQRFVRSIGDNSLVKEDSDMLYTKLRKDYKTYVAEADLARSNAGSQSPLTATDRDEFDKDPFKDEKPVTDGTRSPLSTIERQSVAK